LVASHAEQTIECACLRIYCA